MDHAPPTLVGMHERHQPSANVMLLGLGAFLLYHSLMVGKGPCSWWLLFPRDGKGWSEGVMTPEPTLVPLTSQQLKPAPNNQGIHHRGPWPGQWLTPSLSADKEIMLQCLVLDYGGLPLDHCMRSAHPIMLHQSGVSSWCEEGNVRDGLSFHRRDIKSN